MNMKDALEQALLATKAYIDDNHYNQSEIDGLLDLKSDEGHTHNYAGSSSAGGAATSANKVNKSMTIKLNGGTTEDTNLFTFNGSAAKSINITPDSIGAAPASHGTHLTLGTGAGNAYYGDKGKVAYDHSQVAHAPSNAQKNSDITKAEIEAKLTGAITSHTHSYAGSSSAGGAANSANKVNNNLVIKINGGATEGTNMFTFNGSAGKTINLTAASLGAPASHNHDDRYYTEGEIDTKLGEINTGVQEAVDGFNTAIGAEKERALAAESALQTAINNEASTARAAEAKALTDAKAYADAKVAGILDSAPEALNTLNELAAALGDDPNFSTTIMTEIGKKANAQHGNHVPAVETANNAKFLRNDNTWATVTPDNIGAAKASHGTHVSFSTTAPSANGTASAGSSGSVARADHVHPLQTSVSGNAGSANKVNNSLTVKLNGGATEGTDLFTFNGSAAKSINITPASIGAAAAHNHDAYVNKNAFANIAVSGQTTVAADAVQDTLTLAAGSNVTITTDATNDKITIAAKDTVYTHPSHTAYESGLYKVTVNSLGHVTAATAVAKADITALGIPAQDTVYTHPNSGATAGSYGPSANATPGYNATFNVPYLTVNAAGHVTAISTKTVKIPASDNTWRPVQDSLTSSSASDSLSANQGKILKGLVDGKADMIEDTELTTLLTSIFGTDAASINE